MLASVQYGTSNYLHVAVLGASYGRIYIYIYIYIRLHNINIHTPVLDSTWNLYPSVIEGLKLDKFSLWLATIRSRISVLFTEILRGPHML
jgi:hypothetical protein